MVEKVYLPEIDPEIKRRWQHVNAKVLFLDIDETMIHCIDDRDAASMKGEVRLRIDLDVPSRRQVGMNQVQHIDVDLNVRPGLYECLYELKKSY